MADHNDAQDKQTSKQGGFWGKPSVPGFSVSPQGASYEGPLSFEPVPDHMSPFDLEALPDFDVALRPDGLDAAAEAADATLVSDVEPVADAFVDEGAVIADGAADLSSASAEGASAYEEQAPLDSLAAPLAYDFAQESAASTLDATIPNLGEPDPALGETAQSPAIAARKASLGAKVRGLFSRRKQREAGEAKPVQTAEQKKKLRLRLGIAALVLILVGGYALGVRRFSHRFMPNTTIAGTDVSGLTAKNATKRLEDATSAYTCAVEADDLSFEVAGTDIELTRDDAALAKRALADQNAYLWPFMVFGAKESQVDLGISYNEDALKGLVDAAVDNYNVEHISSSNAYIIYNEETGLYVLDGSVSGMAVAADEVCAQTATAVSSFVPACKLSREDIERTATLEDLPSYRDTVTWANAVRTTDIPITVGGQEVIRSDAAQNAAWVSVGEGPSVWVDEESVRTWATYTVSAAVFHSDDWTDYHLDVDAFVADFCHRLVTGVTDPFEAPTYEERRLEGLSRDKAYAAGGWDSELGRYIDIDLGAQFARLYDENGEVLWESAFVSGSMIEARETVQGTFEIYSMQTDTVLVGLDYDHDGKPDYQSFVSYWMPFYGGFGIHDATWRTNFGGDLYYYSGSHGCINLPLEKAEELYNLTHVGETVYVHDSDNPQPEEETGDQQAEDAADGGVAEAVDAAEVDPATIDAMGDMAATAEGDGSADAVEAPADAAADPSVDANSAAAGATAV